MATRVGINGFGRRRHLLRHAIFGRDQAGLETSAQVRAGRGLGA
jgi:hypothetical protein